MTLDAVRESSDLIYQAGLNNDLENFTIDLKQLHKVVNYVTELTLKSYPDLNIPMHSRWRHLSINDEDRWAEVVSKFCLTGDEKARVAFDLIITSVLLDAGSGVHWRYWDQVSGMTIKRSEGLAIASLNAFLAGFFSSNTDQPLYADQTQLCRITKRMFEAAFQVSNKNPLVGVEGRIQLLNALGQNLLNKPKIFGSANPRIGNLFDYLKQKSVCGKLRASDIFSGVLEGLGDIWPGRSFLNSLNLGDTWRHRAARSDQNQEGFIPFHKLSQWLTYSLVEPIIDAGIEVVGIEDLTCLAEYRNGGLLVDFGVLIPKSIHVVNTSYRPDNEVIVEWRALTVAIIDILAVKLRENLNLDKSSLPLTKILEGGTWEAGRAIAFEKRSDGSPPISIISDGSVF